MESHSLGFLDDSATRLSIFRIIGGVVGATYIDDILVSFENPLFADADLDGMSDAWESMMGLEPNLNDRDQDPDTDGLSNVEELFLNLLPQNRDTDGDGMPDGWEATNSLDPRLDDSTGDLDGDGINNLAEYYSELGQGSLRVWFRADLGVTKDGANVVSAWADMSGNGFDLQGDATWVSNAVDGLPAVSFDGVYDGNVLKTALPVDIRQSSDDFTIIAVLNALPAQQSNANVVYLGDADAGGGWGYGLRADQNDDYRLKWSGSQGPTMDVTSGVPQVVSAIKAGSDASGWINGQSVGSSTVPVAVTNSIGIFALGNGSDPYYGYRGQIAEVLVYNRALGATEREQVEATLLARYDSSDPGDTDGDGLLDSWEIGYFGDLQETGSGDPDLDGVNNLQEFLLGRNPNAGAVPDTDGSVNLRVYFP